MNISLQFKTEEESETKNGGFLYSYSYLLYYTIIYFPFYRIHQKKSLSLHHHNPIYKNQSSIRIIKHNFRLWYIQVLTHSSFQQTEVPISYVWQFSFPFEEYDETDPRVSIIRAFVVFFRGKGAPLLSSVSHNMIYEFIFNSIATI